MFGFSLDKRYIYILLAILVISNLRSYTQADLIESLLTLPAVIIAICFHEYAHAYAADKLGDDTPRMQGRLTLNPLKHLDPIGFVLLLFAGFGWGKPVEINPRNFNRDISMDKGEMIVSFAGPLMNFILAIISAFILGASSAYAAEFLIGTTTGQIIFVLLQELVIINIGLGIFNLIPLPPLDGSKIFINLFPYNAKRWIREHQVVFYYIFLAIWITGLAGIIISPVIRFIYTGLMKGIGLIFGLV